MQYRVMPKQTERLSTLGFGCMRFPVKQDGKIDEEKAFEMLHYAYNNGVTYFDTAWPYHNGESEIVVGKFLKQIDRNKVQLATKLPAWLVKKPEDMDSYLDQQLEKLQTDHIDYYLIHALNKNSWKEIRKHKLFDFIKRAKESGKIKHIGFSFHDKYPVFKNIVNSFDWEFCQIQLNFFDTHYQAGMAGYRLAAAKGMGIVIMEPLRGGKLVTEIPEPVQAIWKKSQFNRSPIDRALRFLWNLPAVQVVLSGMSSLPQVVENMQIADTCQANELPEAELKLYNQARLFYVRKMAVLCTHCGYCMPCPQNVNIPMSFWVYNDACMFGHVEQYKRDYRWFVGDDSRADKCVGCGICTSKCPQQIEIPAQLQKVKELLC